MNTSSISNSLTGGQKISRDQFLKMFVAQTRYQNPLDPIDNQDFAAMLAQFSSLEQLTNLADDFAESLHLTKLAEAQQLIGHYVVCENDDDRIEGIVESVRVEDGKVKLVIDGQKVPLESVVEVRPQQTQVK